MKNFDYIRDLMLTWVISLLALAISISCADLSHGFEPGRFFSLFLWMFVISIPLSAPAFIFFAACGMMVLKKDISIHKKKIRLILINYADILLTAIVLLSLIGTHEFKNNDFFILIPFITLMVASTLSILFLPFKITNKNTPI